MKRLPLLLATSLLLALQPAFSDAVKPAANATKPSPAAKTETAELDCIRFREDAESAMLETVVTRLTSPDGKQQADLIGVVHIGDKNYYKDLNTRLAGYDAVLYEMVGSPDKAKDIGTEEDKPSPLRGIQKMVGTMLKLSFQLDEIDYTKKNFVHADMSEKEFAAEMAKRGESLMGLLTKAMAKESELNEKGEGMGKELEEMDLPQLMLMLMGGKGADKLKVMLAKGFDESERMLGEIGDGDGTAIIDGRNTKALSKLEEVIKSGKTKSAVFYGAGHLPGMQKLLLAKGWKVTSEEWLTAWKMQKTAAPAVK